MAIRKGETWFYSPTQRSMIIFISYFSLMADEDGSINPYATFQRTSSPGEDHVAREKILAQSAVSIVL